MQPNPYPLVTTKLPTLVRSRSSCAIVQSKDVNNRYIFTQFKLFISQINKVVFYNTHIFNNGLEAIT